MKRITLAIFMCMSIMFANAQLIKNDFLNNYSVGDVLEKSYYSSSTDAALLNQWNGTFADNTSGTVSPLIVAPLTYTGYAESGKDYAIQMLSQASSTNRTSGYTLDNTGAYNSGSYYIAFMVNISSVGTALTEFFSFDQTYYSNSRRTNIYVMRGSSTTSFKVAIAPNTTAPSTTSATATEYNTNQTHLFVLKQDFGSSTASIYIDPTITATEPTADLSISVAGSGLTNIRAIDVRQRSGLAALIGGFRFAQSWADAVGSTSTSTTATLTLQQSTGGTLSAVPDVTTAFNIGDPVTITATPDAGYSLTNFVVDGVNTTATSGNTLDLTMDGDKTVTAVFEASGSTGGMVYWDDSFNYNSETALAGQGSWVASGSITTGSGRTVVDGNLTYSNTGGTYILSGQGKTLNTDITAATNYFVSKSFSTTDIASGNIYLSFLFKAGTSMASNADLLALTNYTSGVANSTGPRVWVGKGTIDATKVRFGTTQNSTTGSVITWGSQEFPTTDVVFVVLKYDATNHVTYLYVNPVVGSASEPAADATGSDTGTRPVSCVLLRANGTYNSNYNIGGLRVSGTWADAVAGGGIEAPTTATLALTQPATGGTLAASPDQTVNIGDPVTITATPDAGYALKNFVVDGTATPATSVNTLTLTMDANHTVSADFGLIRTLTLTQPSEGGSLAADPDPTATVFIDGDVVTITATPTGDYVLKNFVVEGVATPATSGNTLTLTMDGDKEVSAVFGLTSTLRLTQPTEGGSLAADQNETTFMNGDIVTFTATPDSGYVLKNFVVNGVTTPATSENTLTLTMDGDKTVTAVFELTSNLTLTQPSEGGSIAADPDKTVFGVSESVTITATPDANYVLKDFIVDGIATSATSGNTLTLTMDADHTVSAEFETATTLTLTQPSEGGSITSDPDKPLYGVSESVTITAIPATGYVLTNFIVNGVTTPATSGNTLVLGMDVDNEVSAVFDIFVQTYDLTLTQAANGSLTASPDQSSFNAGDLVTITATPDANYILKSFNVNGTDTITSGNTLTLTMEGTKTVTATFKYDGPVLITNFITSYNIGNPLEIGYYNTASTADAPLLNQWNGTVAQINEANGATSSPLIVAPLTYSGYSESEKDFAAQLAQLPSGDTRISGYSLTDNTLYDTGSYYVAFMVNFSKITASSFTDFFGFDQNYFLNTRRDVIWVSKGSDNTKFDVGLSAVTTAGTDAVECNLGQTYLFVLKQDFDNKQASLYINPVINGVEPSSSALTVTGTTITNIRGIDIRQRATLEAQVGGFRFANSWADAVAQGTITAPQTATLTLQQPTGGSLAASPVQATFNIGDPVTITATPDANYTLTNFVVNGVTTSATSGNTLTLTMDGDKTVSAVFEISTPNPGTSVVKNDFFTSYSIGDYLEKGYYNTASTADAPLLNQWNGTVANETAGTVSPLIVAPLTYSGYAESGKNFAAQLALLPSGDTRTSGYSLANTTIYNGGSYYVAFMVNFSQVTGSTYTDFFAFDQNYYLNTRRDVLWIAKGSSSTTFNVTLTESTGTPAATATAVECNLGQTYLFVLKQDFDNQQVSLYINPVINGVEPTSAALSVASTTITNIRAIDIRQRATLEAQIGGFRFANTWADAVAQGTITAPQTVTLTLQQPTGGSLAASPVQATFNIGDPVTITATPDANYTLTNFVVNGVTTSATSGNTLTLTMDGDKTVSAVFARVTGIDSPNGGKGKIISEKYYTLTGVEVEKPAIGSVVIKKVIYENGDIETTKFFKK